MALPAAGDTPICTVIMPVRNGRATVIRSIRSVRDQTRRQIELIVVDDGSTDGSAEVVEVIGDDRVRLHRQEPAGVCAARNAGAALARGRYLAFLDCDDIARPTWLETLVAVAERDAASLVCCGVENINTSAGEPRLRHPTRQPNGGRALFLAGSYLVDRDLFRAVGGFDESLGFSENLELGMRLLQACVASGLTTGWTDEVGVTIDRRTSGSSSPLRYAAIRRILAVHGSELRGDRRRHAKWLAMAAVEASRHGKRIEAMGFAMGSLRRWPTAGRSWARLVLTAFPRLARGRWGDRDPDRAVFE